MESFVKEDVKMRIFSLFSFIFTLAFVLAFPHANTRAQEDPFVNGSFETGDFTGWTVINEPDSNGDWFVYSGTTTPLSSNSILRPPVGEFAAVTDQGGPGSHILFQDILVPVDGEATCSLIIYYNNLAGTFINNSDLSFSGGANQQARIDILSTDADIFTVSAGVLLNIYQTFPGDPASLGYTTLDFDLSQFAGETVRFRAAEVDTIGNFNFAIDDVRCGPPVARTIPTLGEWGMIAMAGVLGLAGLIYARRRRILTA